MSLQFQPPEDLVNAYLKRPSPGQEASAGIGNAFQMYVQQKALQDQQATQQQQLALLKSKEAREGREQFYNYGDVSSLPQTDQADIANPVQGPVTPGGQPPQPPSLVERRKKFLEDFPQGLKGVQTTEDVLYVKDPKTGALAPAGTSQRPIKGKTIISGPNASQNAMDFNMNRPRYVPDLKTPEGMPMEYTPSKGLTPARVEGQMKPVASKGDESAIGDATLMVNQLPNVDKVFDAYKSKSGLGARAQATPLGSLLDPDTQQAESSLKLAAFTFGGKQLTGQEKQVVFDALFPKWTDNNSSRESKRVLMKDYMTGKIDLLEAANLLGPAGQPMREMLNQLQTKSQGSGGGLDPTRKARLEELRAKKAAGTLR